MFYVTTIKAQPIMQGIGETINISTAGVLFLCKDRFELGIPLKLTISWPALFQWKHPIALIAFGQIMRTDSQRAAIQIQKHDILRSLK
jgi:hypothetical protein